MKTAKQKAAVAALAAAIAAPCEGLRQWAYQDPVGILTVCQGHTGADIEKGRKYSIAECDALLTSDMRKAVDLVDRCAPDAPESVLVAFSDAAYNMGATIACDTRNSTAARKLRVHSWRDACNELPKWDKARVVGVLVPLPGLTKRRLLERDVCLGGLP